jgi:hypothetical protein
MAMDGERVTHPFKIEKETDDCEELTFQLTGTVVSSYLSNRGQYGHNITVDVPRNIAAKLNAFAAETPVSKALGYHNPCIEGRIQLKCSHCKRDNTRNKIDESSCNISFRHLWPAIAGGRNTIPDALPALDPPASSSSTSREEDDLHRANKICPGRSVVAEFSMAAYTVNAYVSPSGETKPANAGISLQLISLGLIREGQLIRSPKRQRKEL